MDDLSAPSFDYMITSDRSPEDMTRIMSYWPAECTAQIIRGGGSTLRKETSRTGLIGLELRAFSRESRNEGIEFLLEAIQPVAANNLVDTQIYDDGDYAVGWIHYYPRAGGDESIPRK